MGGIEKKSACMSKGNLFSKGNRVSRLEKIWPLWKLKMIVTYLRYKVALPLLYSEYIQEVQYILKYITMVL